MNMGKLVEIARRDRQREIVRLECRLRQIQAQPGSELLAQSYAERITELRRRNEQGLIWASRWCRAQQLDDVAPRLTDGGGGWY